MSFGACFRVSMLLSKLLGGVLVKTAWWCPCLVVSCVFLWLVWFVHSSLTQLCFSFDWIEDNSSQCLSLYMVHVVCRSKIPPFVPGAPEWFPPQLDKMRTNLWKWIFLFFLFSSSDESPSKQDTTNIISPNRTTPRLPTTYSSVAAVGSIGFEKQCSAWVLCLCVGVTTLSNNSLTRDRHVCVCVCAWLLISKLAAPV